MPCHTRHERSRAILRALVAVTFALGGVGAHQDRPADQTKPVFRTTVDLVNVAASVWDASGQPVSDLTEADFEVYERGRLQPVRVFRRVAIPILRSSDEPLGGTEHLEVASNSFPAETRPFLILLDDIHIAATDTQRTRGILRDFVERRVGSGDLVAIATTTGQPDVALDFTAEKSRVLRAIARFSGRRPPRGDFLDPAFDAQATMGLIVQAARNLADAAGPHVTVVLVSEGVHYNTDRMTDPKSSDTIRAVEQAVESLKRANVILYAIDPRGLTERDPDDTLAARLQNLDKERAARVKNVLDDSLRISIQSLVHLSEMTGGFALVNSNDYARDLDRVVRDAGSYYLLGYEPTAPAREGEFRAIEVKVRRAGLRVSARQGYVRERVRPREEQASLPTGSPAIEALYRALPVSDLQLRVQPILLPDSTGRSLVKILVEVAGRELAFAHEGSRSSDDLRLAALTVDDKGHRRNGTAATVKLRLPVSDGGQPDVRWIVPLALNPGRHQVRVAAHDARANRTGSVFADLDVPRPQPRLAISTLVMASESDATPVLAGDWSALLHLPGAPTARRSFTQGEAVHVAARIFVPKGLAAPGEATVRLLNVTASTSTSPMEYRIALQATATRFPELLVHLPTDSLAPGRFVLTVEIPPQDGSGQRASREAAFDLVPRR